MKVHKLACIITFENMCCGSVQKVCNLDKKNYELKAKQKAL